MKKLNATSVSIHVYENEIHFRFWDDVWLPKEGASYDELAHEEEVACLVVPVTNYSRNSHGNEVVIYTGDNNEPYDYTDWLADRNPLPDGNETLLHAKRT